MMGCGAARQERHITNPRSRLLIVVVMHAERAQRSRHAVSVIALLPEPGDFRCAQAGLRQGVAS